LGVQHLEFRSEVSRLVFQPENTFKNIIQALSLKSLSAIKFDKTEPLNAIKFENVEINDPDLKQIL